LPRAAALANNVVGNLLGPTGERLDRGLAAAGVSSEAPACGLFGGSSASACWKRSSAASLARRAGD
jgi:hypothetical protein